MAEDQQEPIKGIYLGPRDKTFKTMIRTVLAKGDISREHYKRLLKQDSICKYGCAFTSELIDQENNYQYFEQIGDLSANKFIVTYIYERFPQLRSSEGVKVAARLRINYGSKNSFFEIANNLGFWEFISATNEQRLRKMKALNEDTFEAFLGVTETIIDENFGIGIGYSCVYQILKGIFDEIDISLNYEDLYDAKTRLKELFDIHGETLGQLVYEETKDGAQTISFVFRVMEKKKILLGKGKASLKADSQQYAATNAITNLKKQGFVKYAPKIYSQFSGETKKEKTTEHDVKKLLSSNDINDQVQTRGKSKHQTKYTSTVLSKYCRDRDYEGIKICLKMGANPNVPDSEGMFPYDRVLIGAHDRKSQLLMGKILKRFLSKSKKVKISENVYNTYYTQLTHNFFTETLPRIKVVKTE